MIQHRSALPGDNSLADRHPVPTLLPGGCKSHIHPSTSYLGSTARTSDYLFLSHRSAAGSSLCACNARQLTVHVTVCRTMPCNCLFRLSSFRTRSAVHWFTQQTSFQPLLRTIGSQRRYLCTASQQPQAVFQQAKDDNVSGRHASHGSSNPIFYSDYPLDRAAEIRKDEAKLSELYQSSTAKVLPVLGTKVLVHDDSSNNTTNSNRLPTPQSLWPAWVVPATAVNTATHSCMAPIFLGLDAQAVPHFAAYIHPEQADIVANQYQGKWASCRTAGPMMSNPDASVAAVASGLVQWHLDSMFHGASGSPMEALQGGFARICPGTDKFAYPRIDPAIITLVTQDDWCLLGRKEGWPAGRYSTLAGFLEIGETLEQAVCREVQEESGVAVELGSVR